MAKKTVYLAVDLGAESGRVIAGGFDGRKLTLQEVHRFPNVAVRLPDGLHWDFLRLFTEIKDGLRLAVRDHGKACASVGVDTWGVDFGLLDRRGALMGNPWHYRDSRTDGMMERAFRVAPREKIYAETGIQFMQLNTLFQLYAMAREKSPQLAEAETLLFSPDLLNYWLTGIRRNEWTIASTSQCLNPVNRRWAAGLLKRLGIPANIFPDMIEPGTVMGPLLRDVAEEVGGANLLAVAVGSHDTASAVAAVPAGRGRFAYLSSGTWSLMGVETAKPVINAHTLGFNLTNEGGVCRTIRLLKNIMGLWLVQQCRATWKAQGEDLSYEEIARLARAAPACAAFVDPFDSLFFSPGDMPARIRQYCLRTGQKPPRDKGAVVRTALESLALAYRRVHDQLAEVTGPRPAALHIVGGGSQNALLNQLAANATGLPVVAGPVEATAAGNILLQMLAQGAIRSLAEGREIVRRSFPTATFEPRDRAVWDEAYARFGALAPLQRRAE